MGIARDGLAEHRIARRANAMVLLDQGWSCERVAAALLLDDDTVRNWHFSCPVKPFVRLLKESQYSTETWVQAADEYPVSRPTILEEVEVRVSDVSKGIISHRGMLFPIP